MKLLLSLLIGFSLIVLPSLAFATPVQLDKVGSVVQMLKASYTSQLKVPYITASSTSATSTLPRLLVPTYLSLGGLLRFDGVTGNSWNDFCVSINGGSGLCDGTDDGITSETDPVFSASDAFPIATADIANWDAAFGWGDHALEGYLTGNETITLSGDASGSGATSITVAVADDSHAHTGSTLSAIDVSDDVNLTAGDGLTLTGDDIDFDGGATPGGVLGGSWASPTLDDNYLLNTGDDGTGSYTLDSPTFAVVASTDFVGIGTTTPQAKLSIVSSSSLSGAVRIRNTNPSGQGNGITVYDEVGTSKLQFGYNNLLDLAYLWGATGVDMRLGAGNAEKVRILASNGNFGIATTAPSARLDVWGANAGRIVTLFSDGGTKFMEMLNTGATTLLGAWDFGGASLEIPNGSSPTVDATGELAVDTTSDQVKYFGASATKVLGDGNLYPAFTLYATSTAFSGTTTWPIGPAYVGETWNGIKCFTDVGTIRTNIGDGTNWMNLNVSSTTVGTTPLSTNNTFTAGEKRYVRLAGAASSPTKLSCSVSKSLTAN